MPRRGRKTLAGVVDAALTIADRDGLRAVTIRSVAKAVGVPTMSLYAYFSTKEELLNLMSCELTRRFFDGEQQSTWQDELLELSERVRRVLLQHPKWMPLLARPTAAPALPDRDRILKLLMADGVGPEAAVQVLMSVTHFATASAFCEQAMLSPDGRPVWVSRLEQASAQLGTRGVDCAVHQAFARTRSMSADWLFSFGARLMIAGVESNRAAPYPPPK